MPEAITLVIPGRNCARTIKPCLEAVLPLLHAGLLEEIIFVDDASTDNTANIVARFPVRMLRGAGRGPGAARNLGWRGSRTPLIWFIDSDCVAEPGALKLLVETMASEEIAGVGGSYANGVPESLLATLIHEEIVARHQQMPERVNFLATFNVLYRRSVLEQLGGFDERFRLAQDAELAFRIKAAGYDLAFVKDSRVAHFHPTRLKKYLSTQTRQGFYRMLLYHEHPQRISGDSYSGFCDHIQPPLAMLSLGALAFGWLPWGLPAAAGAMGLLVAATLRMTWRLAHQLGPRAAWFCPLASLRAYARGLGMSLGVLQLACLAVRGNAAGNQRGAASRGAVLAEVRNSD